MDAKPVLNKRPCFLRPPLKWIGNIETLVASCWVFLFDLGLVFASCQGFVSNKITPFMAINDTSLGSLLQTECFSDSSMRAFCLVCQKDFDNQSNLEMHLQLKHGLQRGGCFRSSDALNSIYESPLCREFNRRANSLVKSDSFLANSSLSKPLAEQS